MGFICLMLSLIKSSKALFFHAFVKALLLIDAWNLELVAQSEKTGVVILFYFLYLYWVKIKYFLIRLIYLEEKVELTINTWKLFVFFDQLHNEFTKNLLNYTAL